MNTKWKAVIAGVTLLIALVIYLLWFMSPYEQCVRAETSLESERLIKLRDEQETLLPGEFRTDNEIRDEQKRLAILNCSHR